MSAKHLIAGLMLTAALGIGSSQAQPVTLPAPSPLANPMALPNGVGLPLTPNTPSAALVNPAPLPEPISPSATEWLNSPFLCGGPTGKNGPIGSEYFVLTGPSIL